MERKYRSVNIFLLYIFIREIWECKINWWRQAKNGKEDNEDIEGKRWKGNLRKGWREGKTWTILEVWCKIVWWHRNNDKEDSEDVEKKKITKKLIVQVY